MTRGWIRSTAGILTVAASLCAFLFVLYSQKGRAAFSTLEFDGAALAFSGVAFVLALVLRAEVFFRLLPSSYIRADSRRTAYRSLFGSLLVRYLPGKIWGIVGQAELFRESFSGRTEALVYSTVFQALASLSALLLAVAAFTARLLFGNALSLLDVIGLTVGVAFLGCFLLAISAPWWRRSLGLFRGSQQLSRSWRKEPSLVFLLLCFHWFVVGCGYWLFIRSIGVNVGALAIAFQGGANAAGALIGLTPGGVGVREAGMVWYLGLLGVPGVDAILVAGVSRIWWFLMEVLSYGTFLLADLAGMRMSRSRKGHNG